MVIEVSPVGSESPQATSPVPPSSLAQRMTPKRFLQYEKMREEAAIGEQ